MRFLIAVLGSCLAAASAAVAADRPLNPAGEPWWSNPPTATSPLSGPKITEYAPATTAGSAARAAENAPPRRVGLAAECLPDPSTSRRLDLLPAVFQQDSPPAAAAAKPLELAQPAIRSLAEPASGGPAAGSPSPPTVLQDSTTSLGLGSHNGKNAPGKSSPLAAMITAGGSLAIVLGLFFFVAWAMRKAAPRGSLLLPKEVFDILGRAPLGARQQVQLLRCGNKLLLVSIAPSGIETLTEVTDPLEVDRIAGICQQADPKSAAKTFHQVFQKMAPESGELSELDDLQPAGTRRRRYHWEEKHA